MKYLSKTDPEVAKLVKAEQIRQEQTLMMIPSENIASYATEEAVGSSLGNKYSEGYPSRRYYQGQEVADRVEDLARNRAQKLFGVPHANVQPYSGSPANLAAYLAIIEPGDTIMGLSLSEGGHLTHGAPASATSRIFRSVQYGVTKGGFLDYEKIERLALEEKPKLIIAGTTAYPRIINWELFAKIAKRVGAYLLTDISHIAGLVVGGAYPSPVPYAHIVTTTTHKTLRGPRGALIMATAAGLKKDPDLGKKIDKSVFPGLQGGPHMNTIAGIAVALREDSQKSFKTYAKQIVANAKALALELENQSFQVVTGGTDSHLLVLDLRNFSLLGNTYALGCERAGIVLNANTIPFDPNPPFYPSGVRLGTPGLTSRNMKEREMRQIAKWMHEIAVALSQTKTRLKITSQDERKRETRALIVTKTPTLLKIQKEIKALCLKYPLKKVY